MDIALVANAASGSGTDVGRIVEVLTAHGAQVRTLDVRELPDRVDTMVLHDRALAKGVSIAPGAIFSPKQKFHNFIRLNAGLDWSDSVERAVETVGHLAREMAKGV